MSQYITRDEVHDLLEGGALQGNVYGGVQDIVDLITRRAQSEVALPGAVYILSHPDDIAVDLFAKAMKEKLAVARSQGRSGWNSQTECTNEQLSDLLRKSVADGNPVDVGNYAMMLQQRGSVVLPSSADGDDYFRNTITKMKETMAAAAEEISEHWDAHCDSKGYGSVNLQRRLEGSYGVNYPGYSLGAFIKLRAELDEAKALAAEVPKLRERLGQAAASYLRLVNASCYSDRDDESLDPEEWASSVVAGGYRAVQYLSFLVAEGLQVYEADGKFRLRQVVDACTVGKSYGSAREAIDAALTDGVSEYQCKGETCE